MTVWHNTTHNEQKLLRKYCQTRTHPGYVEKAEMSLNFNRTYSLDNSYKDIKLRANSMLKKYLPNSDLMTFNDFEHSITFLSERLIPLFTTNRPRVMLLFSNPHPLSILQGMFLSPSSKGLENLFWPVMEVSNWLIIPQENHIPKLLAEICTEMRYKGPFDFIFYCYYAFPTDYPEDIKKIFGLEMFRQKIEPEASEELRTTLRETSVEAVVTFNKGIFNHVAKDPIDHYIEPLIKGELIQSQISGIDRYVPVFLTFPTGWRYRKQYRQLRKASLDAIRMAISDGRRD